MDFEFKKNFLRLDKVHLSPLFLKNGYGPISSRRSHPRSLGRTGRPCREGVGRYKEGFWMTHTTSIRAREKFQERTIRDPLKTSQTLSNFFYLTLLSVPPPVKSYLTPLKTLSSLPPSSFSLPFFRSHRRWVFCFCPVFVLIFSHKIFVVTFLVGTPKE